MSVNFNNANVGGFGPNPLNGDVVGRAGDRNVDKVGLNGPQNPGDVGQAGKNPAFPPLEKSAVMSEQGGVAGLKDVLAGPAETSDSYGMETTEGLHKVVQKSVEGVKIQFLKRVKADEKIEKLEALINANLGKFNKKEMRIITDSLNYLKEKRDDVEHYAASLTNFLTGKANAKNKGIVELNAETEDDREKRLREEIDNMRVSLRNFRSDYNQFMHVRPGFKGWASRGLTHIRNFFTTSRNRFFGFFTHQEQQYVSKDTWAAFEVARNSFAEEYGRLCNFLFNHRVKSDFYIYGFGETSPEDIGDYMDSVADMIEAKSEDAIERMCIKSMKDQLRNIAENGGYKLMELELGLGFGIHLTDNAELMVGGKGKYLYKVFSPGDGSLTIEHVGQGGAEARAKVRVGDILQVDGQANIIAGKGTAYRYRDLDSAARSMIAADGGTKFKSRLNPLFIKGRSILQNICFAGKSVGWALTRLPKLAAWGMDALHRKRTGNHLFDAFDPDKQHQDLKYFNSLKARGVFKAADRLLVPRKNVIVSGTRSFSRFSAGAGANAKLHFGPAHLRTDNSIDSYVDFKAEKTDYRTYMTYLTNEQNGECLGRVRTLIDQKKSIFPLEEKETGPLAGEVRGSTLEADIIAVLQEDAPENAGGDKAVAKRILGLLQEVIDAEEEYGTWFEGLPVEDRNYEKAARSYRTAMLTVAALLERFEELGVEDAGLLASHDDLRETVMSHFENPAVTFPEKLFRDKFFTQHTTADGKEVIKREHFFEYSLLADWKSKMHTNTDLNFPTTDVSGGKIAGKVIARAAANAGVDGVSRLLGIEGSVGITVTEEAPTNKKGKAPWLCQTKKTYDIQFSATPSLDFIVSSCVRAWCKEEGVPFPQTDDWRKLLKKTEKEDAVKSARNGAIAGGLKRIFFDLLAKAKGKNPDMDLQTAIDNFVNGERATSDLDELFYGMDFWRDGHTIQLEFLDGRLSSVSFGNGEKLSLEVGLPIGAPPGSVVIRGGYRFESHENTRSFWTHPSFDALLNKCDSYQSQGNRTKWKMFAQHNQGGFARMADVYAKAYAKFNPENLDETYVLDDSAIAGDPFVEDDLKRIGRMHDEIKALMDNENLFGSLPRQQQDRLRRNYENLQLAEDVLMVVCGSKHMGLGTEEEIMEMKTLLMREVLEFTVRHFDILRAKESLTVEDVQA